MRSITAHRATYDHVPTNRLSQSIHIQSVHTQTGRFFFVFFVNINYFFFFLCIGMTACAAKNEMLHFHCFLAMKTPTRTPVSSTTPASSHRLRASRVLRAPAAPSRPKTSAKQSWNREDEKQNEEPVSREWTSSLSRHIQRKQEEWAQNSRGQIYIGSFTKMLGSGSLKE